MLEEPPKKVMPAKVLPLITLVLSYALDSCNNIHTYIRTYIHTFIFLPHFIIQNVLHKLIFIRIEAITLVTAESPQ